MADTYDKAWQLATLHESVDTWNKWRKEYPEVTVDLTNVDLRSAKLSNVNLSKVNLSQANLSSADLSSANFSEAILVGVNLSRAVLTWANLSGTDLRGARLFGANFSVADLSRANLSGADLNQTVWVRTNLSGTNLTSCTVFGLSAWGLNVDSATIQANLRITPDDEPAITVDDLEVAQFLYLMLHNENLRKVIDTITSKAVLILGRFTPERKGVLDALRDELRKHNYLPVIFDFTVPANKDVVETVTLLARMARFIIADITDAAMVRSELMVIVPALPSVPVLPLLQGVAPELAEMQHLKQFRSMLPIYSYSDLPDLLTHLPDHVIAPAEAKVEELRSQRQ